MRVLVALGCAVAVSLAANASRADDSPASATYDPAPYYGPPPAYYYAPPPAPPQPKRTWYGWQTLMTDGAAITMMYAALNGRESAPLAYGSLLTYNLGAPIVHFAHGNPGRGIGSLAVRSLPSILVFGDTQPSTDLALFTLLSIPTMIAVDAAALAREDEPEPPPRGPYGVSVSPTATATKGGGLVGLAGTF